MIIMLPIIVMSIDTAIVNKQGIVIIITTNKEDVMYMQTCRDKRDRCSKSILGQEKVYSCRN